MDKHSLLTQISLSRGAHDVNLPLNLTVERTRHTKYYVVNTFSCSKLNSFFLPWTIVPTYRKSLICDMLELFAFHHITMMLCINRHDAYHSRKWLAHCRPWPPFTLYQHHMVIQGVKKCRIFWEVVVPTKKRKKSNKYGSGNAYFLSSVHLFRVADDVWLLVYLRDRQGKHQGNKYCMGTVVAEGQRDPLPWTNVTLSSSYNKSNEWTSGWTSPVNKCTGHRKYAFPDPSVIVFFPPILWYVLPSPQYWHFCF